MRRNATRRRIRRALRRISKDTGLALLILSVVSASLPAGLLPAWLPSAAPQPADAETLTSPRYVSTALMPNGQAGLLMENSTGPGEVRFVRYTDEHAISSSVLLAAAAPWYPQLAVLGSTVVAAFVDTRSPNAGKLVIRTSIDNGVNWSAESNPFGTETFNSEAFAPRLVASRSGTTLYLFTADNGYKPKYRSTTDLATWTSPVDAGDTTMRATSANNCGSAGAECYRAHAFGFMETATAGTWMYLTKSDSGYGQSGRGTQIGTLGGSWSTQVDHGGSGGLSGGGDSTATTFLDRGGNVYFIRGTEYGNNVYFKKSTDGGASWGPAIYAYASTLASYITAAPVGLYLPSYASGEYLWFAGFGGSEDTLRVLPLWKAALPYANTGTVRLLGSAGSDLDAASALAFNHGDAAAEFGAGGFTTAQTDLALAGRLLPFSFRRVYNSGDEGFSGPLGPGWSHSFDWAVSENNGLVTIKRGDGARDRFTRNADGTYASAPGVFDTLTKNADGSFTLTTPQQVQYELGVPAKYSPIVSGASPTAYWRLGERTGTTASDAGPSHLNGTYSGTYALGTDGAVSADGDSAVTFAGGIADMGSPSALNITSAITVEFWAKGGAQTGYNYLLSHTDGGGAGYAVYTGGDASYHFYFGRGGGGLHITGAVTGIWDGSWHHYVNTFDGAQVQIWVDGALRLSEADATSLAGYSGNFRLGAYNNGGYNYYGALDEVALYARVLSSSEVTDHYRAGIAPSGVLTKIHEPAGNALTPGYVGRRLSTITDTVGRVTKLEYGFGGISLAKGKPYTSSVAPSGSYPDSGGTELTDDIIGSATDYGDSAWTGYNGLSAPLDLTIDLGATRSIAGLRSYWFHGPGPGIYRPLSVEMFGSTDNVTFTSIGTVSSTAATNDQAFRYVYDLIASASARYVRFRATSGGTWTFVSELQVFAPGDMPATAGTNLVSGLAYTESAAPSGSYPDSGGTELTDGSLANPSSFYDGGWQGHLALGATPLDVTFDLGSAKPIGVVRTWHYNDVPSYIRLPTVVEVLTSADGTTYTSRATTTQTSARNDAGVRWRYELDAGGVSARYVRVRITEPLDFVFTSEIAVFAPSAPPVDLSTVGERLMSISDASGRRVSYSYDQWNRLARVTDTLGNASGDIGAHTWRYGYDGVTRHIAQVIDADGRAVVTNAYDTLGRLTSQKDGLGKTTSYAYGSALPPQDFLAGKTPYASTSTLSGQPIAYLTDQNDTSVAAPLGCGTGGCTTDYDLLDAQVISSARASMPCGFYPAADSGHLYRAYSFVDMFGSNSSTFATYGTIGRLATASPWCGAFTGSLTGSGAGTAWRYIRLQFTDTDQTGCSGYCGGAMGTFEARGTPLSPNASTITSTDPRLHSTIQSYDARKRVISIQDVVGANTYTASFTYDDCGNRSSATDRSGNRTDFTYDTACKGNLLTLKEPQLNPTTPRFTTTWTYDSRNNPTLRTDAKGFTTAWTYDATSNVRLSETRQIDATTSATTKWIYADSANPGLATRVVAPRGNSTGSPDNTYSTALAYDSSGNLTSATDADGSQTTYGYDALGRRTSMVDPDGNATGGVPADHTWTTAYDALDRVTSETDPLAHASSASYDGAGHRVSATDRNGNVTTYAYDAAGRLSTVKQKPDPVGAPATTYTTSITRDDNGNATGVTQANGVVTDYSYDDLNRLATMTSHPATGTTLVTAYTLDGNGNVTNRHAADGVDTAYTFDNLSRLTQIAATGLSTITYAYNELSRRTSMTDGTGTTTYSYDRLGRLTQAAQPNGTTSYAYDLDSNRTTLTYPGPLAVSYVYSNAGRLSSLSDWGSRSSSYTYTPAGLAKTVTLPNTMVTTYSYDRAQRLTNLSNVIGATAITSHAYTLDSEGNRTALSEFVSGITTGASDSFGMTYDGLERLTAVTTTNAESFTLDQASNITARTGPSKTFTIDGSNRPTSDGTNTLTWSAVDRLTGRGADSFGFDPLDRLTSSTVAGTARTYSYSGDGLLQSRTTGGSTVSLLWDPATSPARLLASGSDKIVYGLGPLYAVNGTTVTTYARDGQKSIRAELNGTTVTSSWRYRAYGETAQNSGAAAPAVLGYAGQLLDPSGLYYMRARWYDAASGRFMTRDPLMGDGGSPLSLNEFGYAAASPVQLSDPSGLEPLLDSGSTACGHTCFASWKEGNVGCFDAAICHTSTVLATNARPLPHIVIGSSLHGGLSFFADESDSDASNAPTPSGDGGPGARRPRRFEASPKHPDVQPTDALQDALDHALSVNQDDTRLVGVDSSSGRFVVFDQTYPGKDIFHGHYRTWGELTQKMQAILRGGGIAGKRGKLL